MDKLIDPLESFTGRDEKVEPVELLEEYWFFENLLDRRTKMFRCSSDPSPPSFKINQEMLVKNMGHDDKQSPLTTKKLPKDDDDDGPIRRNLIRAPSLPPCVGRERLVQEEESDCLPASKLTRQASLNPSDVLPPRPTSKMMMRSPSLRTHQARRLEGGMKYREQKLLFSSKEMNHYQSLSHRKSLSELEFEELQGFKDLGFKFDEEDLNPTVVNIIPGLQDKSSRVDRDEDEVRRPYLSEAWLVQRSSPPIPNWVDGRSVGDLKEQIKFWARAVASNVR